MPAATTRLALRALLALALVAAPLVVVGARMARLASRALRAGDAAAAAGDAPRAVRFYLEAAALRLPVGSVAAAATDRLEGMARRASEAGDAATEDLALHALGAAGTARVGSVGSIARVGTASALAAVVGFVTWLGGAVLFIMIGVDKRLRLRPRWATLSGGMFVVGFALFLIGLKLA
jgi:hypothetical protein